MGTPDQSHNISIADNIDNAAAARTKHKYFPGDAREMSSMFLHANFYHVKRNYKNFSIDLRVIKKQIIPKNAWIGSPQGAGYNEVL